MLKSNFREWSKLALEKTFNLRQVWVLADLEAWINQAEMQPIAQYELQLLQKWQRKLLYRGDDWNEIELIEQFIAPILALIDFDTEEFGLFVERPITAIIDDYELSGEPDAIIATGRRAPEIPYFCFHEYKRGYEPKGDPAGQTLVAMLAAQALNNNSNIIYGLYVSGRQWYFMVLHGKEYAITPSYSADTDKIEVIFKILKQLKLIISQFVPSQ